MLFLNLSIRIKVTIFFILLILVSTLNFGMMIYLESRSINSFNEVRKVSENVSTRAELLINLLNAETGQRGFIITGQETYLEPFYYGKDAAREKLKLLKSTLVPINPKILVPLEQLVAKKFAELDSTISLKRSGKAEDALTMINENHGKLLMDEIRVLIEELDIAEKRMLNQLEKDHSKLQVLIRNVFIIESLIFFIVLIFVGKVVKNTFIQPIHKLLKACESFERDQNYIAIKAQSKDEIGQLTCAFNRMVKRIKEHVNNLNQRQVSAQKERDKALLESVTDPLTGLSNRRFMEVELEKQISLSKRHQYPVSLIMFDIDHFKKVNDNFGHVIGDLVLKELGSLVKNEVRGSDLAFRYGGEEFAIVLIHTSKEKAYEKAETLRKKVQSLEVEELRGEMITISLGVTEVTQLDEGAIRLIARSDEALYLAKNSGRNCTKVI